MDDFRAHAAHLFFQLVSQLYERGSKRVTRNGSTSEWNSVFGDTVTTTTIPDRLLHHSHVLAIHGHSYRLRKKRCAAQRANCAAWDTQISPDGCHLVAKAMCDLDVIH